MFKGRSSQVQKIMKLSAVEVSQSFLSPWTRRRGQSIDRKQYHQQSIQNQISKPEILNRLNETQNSLNHINQPIMKDFLQKIQIAKSKRLYHQAKKVNHKTQKSIQQIDIQCPQINLSNTFKRHPSLINSKDQFVSLIAYPVKALNKIDNVEFNGTKIIKSQRMLGMNTQIFFDPFQSQNDMKTTQKMSFRKQFMTSQHKFKTLANQTTQRQKIQNQTSPRSQNRNMSSRKITQSIQQLLKDEAKTSNQTISKVNQYNQESQVKSGYKKSPYFVCVKKNFQKQSSEQLLPKRISVQNNYIHQSYEQSCLPIRTQAVKRIKQQYKRSLRIKKQQFSQKQLSQRQSNQNKKIPKIERQDFLYRTFSNYKRNGQLNLTKTLKINLFNKKAFKQNIDKVITINLNRTQ